jgi:hypothetical protein
LEEVGVVVAFDHTVFFGKGILAFAMCPVCLVDITTRRFLCLWLSSSTFAPRAHASLRLQEESQ